jgi:hypothetical protein
MGLGPDSVKPGCVDDCPCTTLKCKLHGNCVECVRVHRQNQNHLPECMQSMLRGLVKEIAEKVEFSVVDELPAARRARQQS